jgi:hypothetical protein
VQIGYIFHQGDMKDPGADQFLVFDTYGFEVWQLQGADVENPYILPLLITGGPNPGNIQEQRAYWVSEDTIAWDSADDPANTYRLYYAPEGGLQATDTGITGGSYLALTLDPAGLPDEVKVKFPHLSALPALKIGAGDLALGRYPQGHMAVSASPDGASDAWPADQACWNLFTYDGELGVSWQAGSPTIRVWAPTAKSVALHLFEDSDPASTATVLPMTYDPASGVWSISGEAGWKNQYYLYEVEVYVHSTEAVEHNLVTDPYSVSLAMNSTAARS